ncbi:hypothetical protein FJV83_18410 [Mesorhizobium sp. WSM4307]|uniref:hypothetical protein n=1 Tax=unclassified Mesorhizobium TaxID=325217 RepID=UPI00115F2AC7|nr:MULTISPECIES: hypothetical protein [unclassified Mesorhizobium]TRC71631.1 hypothetical protein FJV81_31890 [Mesorhizobium sp. WSM4315]TRC83435.1 hypothetical protein FJV83_18410 [Mesorhizobium sp. WSM4307]
MIEKLQVALMEMIEFGSSLSGKLISLGSSLKRKVMISAAATAEDYSPTKRDWVLIGREAQRAGEHHTIPMGSCHALPKLNCLIKRDLPSPSAPTGCREIGLPAPVARRRLPLSSSAICRRWRGGVANSSTPKPRLPQTTSLPRLRRRRSAAASEL